MLKPSCLGSAARESETENAERGGHTSDGWNRTIREDEKWPIKDEKHIRRSHNKSLSDT